MLSVTFMGMKLNNPLLVAAGPWSSNAETLQQAIDQGAGAVITETITSDPSPMPKPEVSYHHGAVMSATLYGGHSLEEWENEFEKIDKKSAKLIGCIRGGSTSEISYLAKKVERLGADALQLDLFAPVGPTISRIDQNPDKLISFIRAAVRAVQIPVMLRLPHHVADQPYLIHQLESTGLQAVTLIESIRAIKGVDIETGSVDNPTYVGYTGANIRPITLAAVATFSQISSLDISAAGGIVTAHHAIECLMLGANTVQLGSAILNKGYPVIGEVIRDLEQWMRDSRHSSIEDLRGYALT